MEPQHEASVTRKAVKELPQVTLFVAGSELLRRFNALAETEADFTLIVDALSTSISGSETLQLIEYIIATGKYRYQVWAA